MHTKLDDDGEEIYTKREGGSPDEEYEIKKVKYLQLVPKDFKD